MPEFSGADEQLWKIEQLTDGTWRIAPKAIPGCHHPQKWCLYSVADSTPTLGKFDFNNDNAKWDIKLVKLFRELLLSFLQSELGISYLARFVFYRVQ